MCVVPFSFLNARSRPTVFEFFHRALVVVVLVVLAAGMLPHRGLAVGPGVDLGLTISDAPDPVLLQGNITYSVTITNQGTSTATGVTFTDPLPSGVLSFVSATPSQGNCGNAGGTVTCNLGAIAGGGSATLTVVATANRSGTVTNTSTVTSIEPDTDTANNTNTRRTSVIFNSQVFSNPAVITFPAELAGPAVPYPSTINVSGLTAAVYTVIVTLSNMSHTIPDDIDILLVSPSGQAVIIMSDAGGGSPITGVTLSLDEFAVDSLPNSDQIVTGLFVPSNYGSSADTFNAPAPAAPYGFPFVAFDRTNPNGVWSLYCMDDLPNDTGTIGNGWSLRISQSEPMVNTTIVMSDSPDPVAVGGNLVYTMLVTNRGPARADGVSVTDVLPPGTTFVSATSSQGSCANNGGTVTCLLGTMNNNGTATVTLTVSPTVAATITNSATVGAIGLDFTPTNNMATVTTLAVDPPVIVNPPQSLAVAQGSNAPFSVTATGAALRYQWRFNGANIAGETNATFTVSNAQPANAGAYTVRLTNIVGSVTSTVANLTVIVPPAVTTQPLSRTNLAGSTATFTVAASGSTPLNIQWFFNLTQALAGETNATLTLNNVQTASAGGYRAVVSNGAGAVTSLVAVLTVQEVDFGDAPSAYPTLLAANGARHFVVPGLHLGAAVDLEPDGQPNAAATGDDIGGAGDEDGVQFIGPLLQGQPATVQVVASAGGVLNAWLDWNANSSWAEAGEQIYTNRALVAGTNSLTLSVPAGATAGGTFARFRFSSVSGLSFDGSAPDGEVEDYALTIIPAIDLVATQIVAPDPVGVGSNLVCTITVSNRGPAAATGATLTNVLPAGVTFVSATATSGGCTNDAGVITCALGTLAASNSAVITITVTPDAAAMLTNTASASAVETDVNLANNTAAATATAMVFPAVIVEQPRKKTVFAGASHTFAVTATGTLPLSYQWSFNGAEIPGATASTLPLVNIQPGTAGQYRVVVTNALAAVTSVVAMLTVRGANDPAYPAPAGGWAYLLTGDSAAANSTAALDGTWNHDNSIDSWAGDGRGPDATLGGVATASGILTIEDALAAGTDNRRIYFTHNLLSDVGFATAATILDAGVTLTFRARLTPPADPLTELTNAPNGWINHSDGKGMFGLRQVGGGIISFSLNQTEEDLTGTTTFGFGQAGLHLNSLNGDVRASAVDPNEGGTLNLLPLDPAAWHEFWITIQDNGADPGTHRVSIYLDGALTPVVYNVTSGNGADVATTDSSSTNYLALGLGSTAQRGAVDVDFFGYKPGVITPNSFDDPVGIVLQPVSRIVAEGQTASFNVGVTGTPPHFFQWYGNGAAIADATNALYTTAPLVPADNGTVFTVVVTNGCNSVTSSPASLNLLLKPAIVAQPQNLIATNGDTVNFSVAATSDGDISYQWRFGGANLLDETNTALAFVAHPPNAGGYNVVVGNASGAVTSQVATLTVRVLDFGDAPAPYPTLLVNNGARHVIVPGVFLGTTVDVDLDGLPHASALGDDLDNTDDEDGVTFTTGLLAGQLASIEVSASTNGLLDAWIDWNGNGSWADAGDQVFTNQALTVGVNPLSFPVPGAATAINTFARFRFSTAGGLAFTGPAADGEAEDYAVTITPVTDLAVALTDAPDPVAVGSNLIYSITITNAGPSAATGVTLTNVLPGTVNFVSATPSQGTCNNAGNTVTCVLGGLSAGTSAQISLVVVPTAAGTINNSVTVTGNQLDLLAGNNSAATSTTSETAPVITVAPLSLTTTQGQTINFSVTATGTTPLSYLWSFDGSALTAETNATLTIAGAQPANAGSYTVRVSNRVGLAISAPATLTVLVPPAITAQPQSLTNLAGGTAVFTVTATGTAPLGYQWFFNGNNPLAGQTAATLQIIGTHATNAGGYSVSVQNAAGAVTSVVASLVVLEMDFGDAPAPPYPTRLADNGARHLIVPGIHLGATVDFEPDGQPNSFATGDDVNATDDEDGVFFTSALYVGQPATVTVVASTSGLLNAWLDGNGDGDWLDAGEQIFLNRSLTAGTNLLTFTVPAGGFGSGIARFRFSTAGGLGFTGEAPDGEVEDYAVTVDAAVDLAAGMSDSPDPVAVGSNLTYTILVTNRGPSTATGVALTDVLPANVTFSSATPSQGGCTNAAGVIQCQLGNMSTGSVATVTIVVAPGAAGMLTNAVSVSAAEHEANPANNAALAVTEAMEFPGITTHPHYLTTTNGFNVALTVVATGTTLTYQWRQNGTNLPGANSPTLSLFNIQPGNAGSYAVLITNGVGTVLSQPAIVVVLVPPAITTPPLSVTATNGDTVTFSVTATGTAPLGYQWRFNGADLAGEGNPTMTLAGVTPANAGNYSVRVNNQVSTVESAPATLMVMVPPTISTQPQNVTTRAGNTASFSVTASGTVPLGYQWYFNGTNVLSGATNPTLTLTNVQKSQTGDYSVRVVNVAGLAVSAIARLTVSEVDFGDAPDSPFPTRLLSNGARHTLVPGVHLGLLVDFEPDGQPNGTATGDDAGGSDDEDGVTFPGPLLVGQLASVAVTASTNGFLDAWMDFNANGGWTGGGEQIFTRQALTPGLNMLSFQVPGTAVATNVFARFRFSTAGGLSFEGPAADGEVEDYRVTVTPAADLRLTGVDSPDPVSVQSNLTYTLTVTNRGPSSATGVTVTDVLPANVIFGSAVASQGTCSESGGTVTCSLGTLASGSQATVTLTVATTQISTITNLASVTANETDVNPADNTAAQVTAVVIIAATVGNVATINVQDNGIGIPYPSTVSVSGLTSAVFKVTVTLFGLTHSFPDDLDLLLVGPGGQSVVLMSDAGGGSPLEYVTFTFDDASALTLPDSGQFFQESYRPANYDGDMDVFPSPAPPEPYGSTLSVFNGTDPNGVWSLYLLDDAPDDVGLLEDGWRLTIAVLEPIADLAVVRMEATSPVAVGSNLTCLITVSNRGPALATGVVLTDALPPNAAFVSASGSQGGCTNDGGVITCSLGSLSSGGSAVVTLVVAPGATGLLTNQAVVLGTELDLAPGNNVASAVAVVKVVTDLVLSQVVAPDPGLNGQLLTYSLALTNHGPNVATSVALTDWLPPGVDLISLTPSQGACSNLAGVIHCDFPTLPVGDGATVTIVVRPNAAGTKTNSASVTADEIDFAPVSNLATALTVVHPSADLAVTKAGAPDPVPVSHNVSYSLVVTNHGPNTATGVMLTDPLPKNVLFVSAVASQGGCTNTSGIVTCAAGAIPAGGSATVTITVTATAVGTITNTTTVASVVTDPYGTNNSATTLTTVIPAMDLAVRQTDSPDPAMVNENLSYIVVVTNAGPSRATAATLTNRLPEHVTLVSATPSQGSCSNVGGAVTCHLGAINSGTEATVVVVVVPHRTGVITNVASVTAAEFELASANNSAAQSTAVIAASGKVANPTTITIPGSGPAEPYPSTILISGLTGTVFKITVTLSNLTHTFPDDVDVILVGPRGQTALIVSDVGGGDAVEHVVLTLDDDAPMSLPDFSQLASGVFRPTNFDPTSDAFPPPAPAGPYGATLAVFKDTDPNGVWSLYIVDDASGDSGQTMEGWCLSIATIDPIADLSLAMFDAPAPVAVGSNLTYTLTVTNHGLAGATDVIVSDTLPAGVNFVSVTASQGGCAHADGVVFCDLGSLASGGVAAVTIVVSPTVFGPVTNFASVTGNEVDFALANNSASAVTTVEDPPVVTLQPQSQTRTNGGSVGFSVAATGTPPYEFQWLHNGSDIVGETNSSLALNGLTLAETGGYRARVGNRVGQTFSAAATLTVLARPVISDIADAATDEDTPKLVAFTVTDVETPAGALIVTGSSSNPALVPNLNLEFGGGDSNRTLTVTPATNQFGSAIITVTVQDADGIQASDSFVLTVNLVNDPPVIADIADHVINEDGSTGPIAVVIGDVETAAGGLLVGASSTIPVNLLIGGSDSNRTVTVTPLANQFGSATITVTVSDGNGGSASDTFELTVLPVNDAPTLAAIGDLTVAEDSGPHVVALAGIGSGATNEPQLLTVLAASSDPAIIPNPVVTYSSPDGTGSLSFAPLTNAQGSVTITVTVNDGGASNNIMTRSFTVTVSPVNDLPQISDIADDATDEDTAKLLTFTVGDVETAAGSLTMSASSSNTGLVSSASYTFGGAGSNRTVSVLPVENQHGSATITVTVTDGHGGSASDSFTLTVHPVNDAPTITGLADQTALEDVAAVIAFTVGDAETPPDQLFVVASSTSTSLVANAFIQLGGSGSNRLLTITLLPEESGVRMITVTVDDGTNIAHASFDLTVLPANDAPTLAPIGDVTIDEDAGPQVVALSGIGSGATNENDTLMVTAVSSNPAIIPHPIALYSSPEGTGTVSFQPLPDANGTVTITVTVDDGGASNNVVHRSFTVMVQPFDDAPVITDIADQVMNEDVARVIPFTVEDVETPAGGLAVTVSSSNTGLVASAGMTLGGAGASRTLTILPATNRFGSATITVTVSDGTNSVSDSFALTVLSVNDAPTLAQIADETTAEESGEHTLMIFGITSGAANEDQALVVTAVSSDTVLVAHPAVTYTSPNEFALLRFLPLTNASGSVTITVTVTDDGATNNTASRVFTVTIRPVNDLPVISDITNHVTPEDTATGPISFTVGDQETAAGVLVVTAASSNTGLVSTASIQLSGTGSNRTVNITPLANQSGSATITLTVTDASNTTASASFTLTVTPVNDAPTVADISNQVTNEDTPVVVPFTISDLESPAGVLTVSAVSTNTSLVPNAAIVAGGAGGNRTLTISPTPNNFGTTLITVTVSDGTNSASDSFLLTVRSVNDQPFIDPIGNVVMNEDAPEQRIVMTSITAGPTNENQVVSITATSSVPSLFYAWVNYLGNNIGSVRLTPQPNLNGSATITVTVNDAGASNNILIRTFTATVLPVNDAPVVSNPGPQFINEGATRSVSFTVGDAETAATGLTVSATSSNPTLLPTSGLALSGTGTNRTLLMTPLPEEYGFATVTLIVSDGQLMTTTSFDLIVNGVNDPPTLAALPNLVLNEDPGPQTVPLTGITPGQTNELQNLVVTATSSNPALIPHPTVSYVSPAGTGSLAFLVASNLSGSATIVVSVDDGQLQNHVTSRSFTVTVNGQNDLPTISDITDRATDEDTVVGPIPFTVADVETAAAALTVAGTSSNPALVPNANIIVSGAAGSRTVTISPATNQSGSTIITLTVTDAGGGSASDAFVLTVNPVNAPPVVQDVADTETDEDTAKVVTIAIGDLETAAGSLAVSASSSHPALVPGANLVFSGSGSNRTLTITPVVNQFGNATLTVTVTDADGGLASDSFVLTVRSVNDVPAFDPINDIVVNEDAGSQNVVVAGISMGAANEGQTVTVSAISSDPALVPNPVVNYNSPDADAVLTIAPSANASGTTTITVTVGDGGASNNVASRTFTVTVNAVNDLPTLSAIGPQVTDEDTPLLVAVTVSDAETAAGSLTVGASSSNPSLVPNANLVPGGAGGSRTLTITPVANQSGTAIITVTVDDGSGGIVSNSFVLAVNPVNDAPAISDIVDQTTGEDVPKVVNFTVSDAETAAGSLTVTGSSSNPSLVPNANLVFSGGGGARTLTVTPAPNQSGIATITVTVHDGDGAAATDSFVLTVTATNDAPVISDLADQATNEDTPLSLAFAVADVETAAGSLTVTATSSSQSLVPNANLVLAASGGSRTLTITPVTNQSGATTITLTVSDGSGGTNTDTFVLTVNAVNDAPTLAAITNRVVNEDAALQTVNLSGISSGATNEAQTLVVTASSSNTNLVPSPAVNYTNANPTGTITFTPVANANGTATITVSVNDGGASNNFVTRTFTVTVNATNDPPTISDTTNRTVLEDSLLTIAFTVADLETAPQNLIVTATSANQALVANTNIVISGSGTNRLATMLPTLNQSGTATITLTVNDGTATANDTFVLTVTAVNDPPTLNPITNVSAIVNFANTDIFFDGIGSGAANESQTLTVTAVSSNTALVGINRVDYSSPAAVGSVRIESPSNTGTGTSIVAVTVSDGITTFTRQFTVFVWPTGNALPSVSTITNRTTAEDTATAAIPFTIGDATTPATLLTVAGMSSNTNVVPNSNIVFGGSGSNRTATITPAPNQFGTAAITISVSDTNFGLTNRTFTLTVTSVNDLPTIADITDQSVGEDTGTAVLPFVIGDVETLANGLTVTGSSSNPALVPNANVVFGGGGSNRTVVVSPLTNQSGSATITVTVTDGNGGSTNDTFVVTVNSANDPPVISDIADQAINEDGATAALAFIVGDLETAAGSLTPGGSSADTNLVPNANIVFGGSASNRTVTVTPAPGHFGAAVVTITITDTNGGTASDTFVLTVNPVNDAPTLDALNVLSLNQGAGQQTVNLTGIGTGSARESQLLAVSVTSSNPALVPTPTVTYTSPNATGTLTFTPGATNSGLATITVTVSDGQSQNGFVARTFDVSVNGSPVISPIADQSISEDTATAALAFTVGDAETPAASLTVAGTSSNPALVPNGNLVVGGAGANGTVTATPVPNGFGNTTITLTVSDANGGSTSGSFVLVVSPVNDTPTLNPISNLSTNEDAGLQTISLTGIGSGAANESDTLVVTASSSNPALIPNPTVNYTSPNSGGTLSFVPVPQANGTATITVIVDDLRGQNSTATQTFLVTITADNDLPAISDVPNQVTDEDTAKVVLFTVADLETAAGSLTMSASSSDTTLVPNGDIVFGGTGASRWATITPATNRFGNVTITLTVADGDGGSASDSFVLTVNSVNDQPAISDIANQVVNEDTATAALAFTVGDVETAAGSLTLTASSSNTNLVPVANVTFAGSGSNRTVVVTPAANQSGAAIVTVTVTDASGGTASDSLVVTVSPVNDAPTISPIADQATDEDTPKVIPFTVGDPDRAADQLTVTVETSNPTLVPTAGLALSGTASNRTLTVTPAANEFGAATITITVMDGQGATTARPFLLTVNAVNDLPLFLDQPQGLTVNLGASASFTAAVVGTAPLRYQWRRNGANLTGRTNTSLTLAAAQLADAGDYSLVVSNVAGVVTSQIARLRVLDQPTIIEITRVGATAHVSFTTISGLTYFMEYKNSLFDPAWTSLRPVTGTGSVMIVADPSATEPNRVYRVRAE